MILNKYGNNSPKMIIEGNKVLDPNLVVSLSTDTETVSAQHQGKHKFHFAKLSITVNTRIQAMNWYISEATIEQVEIQEASIQPITFH
jgi:hypothetical protein